MQGVFREPVSVARYRFSLLNKKNREFSRIRPFSSGTEADSTRHIIALVTNSPGIGTGKFIGVTGNLNRGSSKRPLVARLFAPLRMRSSLHG